MTSYNYNNPFAKILNQELPCYKIFEDSYAYAFLDIMPKADGHTLVIPKKPVINIFDISIKTLSSLSPAIIKVSKAIKHSLNADGLIIKQLNNKAAGQEVFHFHIHLIPRWDNTELYPKNQEVHCKENLQIIALKIKNALKQLD